VGMGGAGKEDVRVEGVRGRNCINCAHWGDEPICRLCVEMFDPDDRDSLRILWERGVPGNADNR